MTVSSKGSSDLKLRTITGAILVLIAGSAIWFGAHPIGRYAFAALIGAAAVLALREWSNLTRFGGLAYRLALVCLAAALALVFVDPRLNGLLLGGAVIVGGAVLLVPFTGVRALGLAYIGLPAAGLLWLRALPWGFEIVAWLVAVVVATDIFAYFSGKLIGGRKLAPQISPGKTWTGLVGGVIAATLVGWGVATHYQLPPFLAASGGLMAVLAQAGDLYESWLKRRAGVKDSGHILPGHGGVFDRIDGLLPVALATTVAMLLGMDILS